MATRHPLLKGLGILGVFILLVFVGVFFFAYLTGGDSKVLSMFAGEGIGVLQIEGTIDDSRDVLNELKRFKEAPWIKAIVVRIDSPGGDAMASDDIWREMNLLSKKKPVVISMSDAAASGGRYSA